MIPATWSTVAHYSNVYKISETGTQPVVPRTSADEALTRDTLSIRANARPIRAAGVTQRAPPEPATAAACVIVRGRAIAVSPIVRMPGARTATLTAT
jgi:hypothetical protein